MNTKKLIYLGLSLLTFGLFIMSCNDDENNKSSNLQQRPTIINLNLPFYSQIYDENNLKSESGEYRFTKDGREYITEIMVTYDDSNDNLIKISISDNYSNVLDISTEEIENAFVNEVNSEKEGEPELSPHASCIEWCKKNYTDADGNKIKGRGACKGNCWVDTAIRVLEALAPL